MSEEKATGRPPIKDAIPIVLFVEAGIRRTGLTLRQFCDLRSTKYWGGAVHVVDRRGRVSFRLERRHPLRGEALRRRYGKAWLALNMSPPPLAERDAYFDPVIVNKARLAIDRMVTELLAS